ncbi:LysR family transcriptional regulator [Pseudomonas aeruginosa]|nr:LysR family transcriptional regulator [Pseudomonas aeruginosa]MBF3099380.1 LysR family transcriptional regulator [Pseudomonas aeruginosa]
MSDLRQFRHFVALAEHGHYARAAEAVNLSQPALSRSIQALEGQLGCTLVERGSRGVALTAHGRLVLEHARRLLAGHRALHNAVSQLGNLDSGELRLGGGPFPAARLLPEALAGFSSAHPRVRVALLIEDWQTLRQRLLDDAVELFVADIRELQGDPQLRIHPLREHPGVLFCRPGHPLLGLERPSAGQLADYPLAGPRLPAEVRGDLARLLQRDEPLGIQCDDVLMLKGLVGSSELISLAPWDVVAADVEAGRLALIGSGPVAHAHLQYVKGLRDWQGVRVHSPCLDERRLQSLRAIDARAEAAGSLEEALDEADVILLCTSSARAVIDPRQLERPALVTSISTNAPRAHEVPAESLAAMDVYCDYRHTTPGSAGEMLIAAEQHGWSPEAIRGDLAELLSGQAPRPEYRRPAFFRSIGLGLEDVALANALYRLRQAG